MGLRILVVELQRGLVLAHRQLDLVSGEFYLPQQAVRLSAFADLVGDGGTPRQQHGESSGKP